MTSSARPLALILAALLLWGCLVALSAFIHAPASDGGATAATRPFVAARGAGVDFYQFWIVGRTRGPDAAPNIYDDRERDRMAREGQSLAASAGETAPRLAASAEFRGHIESFSTPALYATIGALTGNLADFEQAYDRYLTLCLAALVVSFVLLARLFRHGWTDAVLLLVVVLVWSEPLASDLRVGNVNLLQLAALAGYLALRRWSNHTAMDVAAGLVLGLLVAFKPTLGLVALLLAAAWAFDRDWRMLMVQGLSATAGSLLAVGAGAWYLGSWSIWYDWITALSRLGAVSDISLRAGNYSLAQFVEETMGAQGGARVIVSTVVLSATLAVSGWLLWRTRRPMEAGDSQAPTTESRFMREALVVSTACGLSVIGLSLTWPHYYLLLTPLVLLALRPLSSPDAGVSSGHGQRFESSLALLGFLAVLGRPLMVLTGRPSGQDLALAQIAGAWLLVALGGWQIWSGRPNRASTELKRNARRVTV